MSKPINASLIARYASANFVRQILGLLTGFLRPKLLSPELYGLWSLLKTIPVYAGHAHLGSREALRYLTPMHEAAGDEDLVRRTEDSVFFGSLAFTAPVCLTLFALALASSFDATARFGLAATGVLVALNWYFEHYVNTLKGRQDFTPAIVGNLINAVGTFVLSLALIWLFGFYGVFAAVILPMALVLGYLRSKGVLRRHRTFDRAIFINAVRIGFPIVGFNLVLAFVRTADRYVIASTMGARELGYYGISAMVVGILMNIPGVSRDLTEPKLMQTLHSLPPALRFERFFMRPLIQSAFLMPLLIGPAVLCLPAAVNLLLPRYAPGILPTQILAAGSFFIALTYPTRGIIVADGMQGRVLAWLVPVLGAGIGLTLAAAHLGYGLAGVACGSTGASLLLFATLYAMVTRRYATAADALWQDTALMLAPFPAMCLALPLCSALVPDLHPVAAALVRAIAFEALFGAVFLIVMRLRPERIPSNGDGQ